ncbi:hypothetical protein [Methanospirillum hungatei]|jgi:hypothetical protein|uniref:hypothetical protein n=1 Tax=Methanospirillum hungatei TaxID=2203 RepID=UPI001B6E3F51|nr:hypothetical protein [Methanospirillum hungatei]MBP7034152.1 hypothetical protein [Methanospirillum sp.]MCA1915377.1 hypothetical protein [Methanospirillum hungatei]HOW05118.1 hypothetical protein [Methanospirillum hungatei]
MKNRIFLILIFIVSLGILSSGCINQDLGSLSDSGPVPVSTTGEMVVTPTQIPPSAEPVQKRVMTPDTPGSGQLKAFIEDTFPELTKAYMAIRTADRALDAAGIQEKALALETAINDLTDEYSLDRSLPEKNVFPGLTSKEEVIFNKYLGFIRSLGSYASSLKQAVYWKNAGTDAASLGNYRRYQDLADNYGKKVITDIKTLDGYCSEWGFPYLDKKYVREYSFNS